MKTLYYSLIYPHLIYAVEVWGSADKTYLDRILLLQKRIVRLLTFSDKRQSDYSFPPSNPLFLRLEILKVEDVFKLNIAKFIYNCLNNHSPVNFHTWFKLTSQTHKHNTRSKFIDIEKAISTNNLFIPTARTSHYGLKQIKVLGPRLWNELPPVIRNNKKFAYFHKEIRKYLLRKYEQ